MSRFSFLVAVMATLFASAPAYAALMSVPLTADVANSSPSSAGGNLANTLNDPFAYDPASPTSPLPVTVWTGGKDHYHGPGGTNPTVYWTLSEITYGAGDALEFDFYGRTSCCPDRDNNYDIALLTGGYAGTVVGEVKGNNAPDAGIPENYLRTDMASVLTAGDKFDTIRIVGNDFNFTIAEVRLAHDAAVIPEPTTLVLAALGLLGLTMFRRRRKS